MLKSMIDAGVPQDKALRFSGDDAVSGSGRLNGINGQDGDSGFNAGELKVYQEAAAFDPSGNTILMMMQGHNHDTGIAPDQITNPNINKELGLPTGDRDVSADRAALIAQGLNSGTVRNNVNDNGGGGNDGGGNDGGGGDGGGGGGNVDGGGGDGGGEVEEDFTGAGTGTIEGVLQDPATTLATIAQTGFADGITGVGAQQLAQVLQQLLMTLLQGGQLDPAVLAALQALVPQLQASTDPNLQQMGLAIDAIGKSVDPATGTLSPALVQQLAPVITSFVTMTGAPFLPELEAAAPELVAQAKAAAAAAGTTVAGGTTTGAALAQPGAATLPVAGAGATADAAAGAGHQHPGTTPAATPAPARTAPAVTTTATAPVTATKSS